MTATAIKKIVRSIFLIQLKYRNQSRLEYSSNLALFYDLSNLKNLKI